MFGAKAVAVWTSRLPLSPGDAFARLFRALIVGRFFGPREKTPSVVFMEFLPTTAERPRATGGERRPLQLQKARTGEGTSLVDEYESVPSFGVELRMSAGTAYQNKELWNSPKSEKQNRVAETSNGETAKLSTKTTAMPPV